MMQVFLKTLQHEMPGFSRTNECTPLMKVRQTVFVLRTNTAI